MRFFLLVLSIFLALLLITVILCSFFFRHRSEPLWDGWRNEGNVMWLFLVLLGLVLVVNLLQLTAMGFFRKED